MINGLIAEAAGVQVEMVVSGQPVEPAQEIAPEPQESPQPELPLMTQHFFEMIESGRTEDLPGVRSAYQAGLKLIHDKKADLDPIVWECLYQWKCFEAGDKDILERLKLLEQENPDHPRPPATIARYFMEFEDFNKAARKFDHAAALATDREKLTLLLDLADALKRGKQHEEARDVVLHKILPQPLGSRPWLDAIALVYDVFKLLTRIY